MRDGFEFSGVPLGGLGTGSVELRRDGMFHEWQIMNNAPWGPGPSFEAPHNTLFFGMQVQGDGGNRSALLATPTQPGGLTNDPYEMPWLEHASNIDCNVRFPFTELSYGFDRMPVEVSLQAFSPFIPLDSKNSGLPLAYFTFSLKNTGKQPLKVTLFGCQRNLVGYTTPKELSKMEIHAGGRSPYLAFGRENVPSDRSDAGSMVLGLLAKGKGTTSYAAHFRRRDLWEPLRESGRLDNKDLGALEQTIGNMGASQLVHMRRGLPFGALARTVPLQPGESAQVTYVMAWHFPNLIERAYKEKNLPGSNIGHRYEQWFADAADVFTYAARNFQKLHDETAAFVDAYYESSMPPWLLDAIAAQLTTLTKASWWDRSGRFGIWEGLGCCGLQTTDITHYGSFPIAQFFPDIQKSQMRLTRDNVEAKGKIPHMMPGTFACCDVDHRERIDLIPQFILLVWRDVLWTGDLDYLREMWQTIKDSLAYFTTKDTDGDGLPNNTGPDQTYDQFPLKGTSAFVGWLYIGALKATADMAALMKDADYEKDLRDRYHSASGTLQKQLWNGTYYRLCYDPVTGEANEGVMADQLNADWFMRQTTGEGLVDNGRVKSALQTVIDVCTAPAGYLANCAWTGKGAVKIGRHTADQANWPWSGVEYAVAAHLILMGMEREGIQVARDVWERYERSGMRFNHIECGGHYYRAMSSWAIYLALGGYIINVLNNTLSLRFTRKAVDCVLAASTCWGTLEADGNKGSAKIKISRGKLKLKTIRISGIKPANIRVQLNGRTLEAGLMDNTITLNSSVTLRDEDVLTIRNRP